VTPRRLASLAALAAVVAAAPATARAEDTACSRENQAVAEAGGPDPSLAPPTTPEAQARLKAGNTRHRVQQYAEAIEEYIAGALLDEAAPVFLYNLGQSYRLLGEYKKSIYQYRLFLDRGHPGAALRALVECHITAMERELAQAAATEPPTGPADGEAPYKATVEPPPRVEAEPPPRTVVLRAPERWYADPAGWVLVGAGGLGAAFGGVLLLDAAALDDEADGDANQQTRQSTRAAADSRRQWGTITLGVSAAAIVAGVVKLAISPSGDASGRRAVLLPTASGLAIAGEF
jgi:tetratricopeptide (TPR) repeat protein